MQIRFANPTRRWLFFLGVLLIAGTLAILGGKNGLAELYGRSSQADDWLRAAQLEPSNAEHWYRLARYRQLDVGNADPALAISYYRRALAIDPRSAFYWLDLASAYELQGDVAQAAQAYETAKSVHPISAEVAWRYGNFLMRQGNLAPAYAEIHRAVLTDHRLAALAISRCWRAEPNIERILNEVLPAESDVYVQALDFVVAEKETDAALVVWKRLMAVHASYPLFRSFALLDELIAQKPIEEASAVWKEALAMSGTRAQYSPPSLVWDGGFETDFTDGGFGWRHRGSEGTSFDFDTETRRSGVRSLRVTFDGSENIRFENLWQRVPVEPNTHYHFAAYLRTQEISTDSGMRFRLAFSEMPALLTPNEIGTHPWTREELDFTTGPQTRLLLISLLRWSGQKFDNKLRGTVWVDDVSLVPLAPESSPAQ